MARIITLLIAYCKRVSQLHKGGLDVDADALMPRLITTARRIQPSLILETHEDFRHIVVVTLQSVQVTLETRLISLVESDIESPETILPLLVAPLTASLSALGSESFDIAETLVMVTRVLEDLDPDAADDESEE